MSFPEIYASCNSSVRRLWAEAILCRVYFPELERTKGIALGSFFREQVQRLCEVGRLRLLRSAHWTSSQSYYPSNLMLAFRLCREWNAGSWEQISRSWVRRCCDLTDFRLRLRLFSANLNPSDSHHHTSVCCLLSDANRHLSFHSCLCEHRVQKRLCWSWNTLHGHGCIPRNYLQFHAWQFVPEADMKELSCPFWGGRM